MKQVIKPVSIKIALRASLYTPVKLDKLISISFALVEAELQRNYELRIKNYGLLQEFQKPFLLTRNSYFVIPQSEVAS